MRILAVLSRFPYPIEKGDKLRAYYQLRDLGLRHEVHLVALTEHQPNVSDIQEVEKFCASVHIVKLPKWRRVLNLVPTVFNSAPFQVNYFQSREMKQKVGELIDKFSIDVCYVQLIRLGMNLPFEKPVAFFLDYMDAFSKGMQKRIPLSGPLIRPVVKFEYKRLVRYEEQISTHFHGWSIISSPDAEEMPEKVKEKMLIIPNGVGEGFFEDASTEEKEYDLIFTGNMGYHPNIQAAKFLIERILPVIESRGHTLKVCIAGARPAAELKKMASDTVHITGWVDDIRICMRKSKLFVAPLVSGSGLQNKLLESMAMSMPTLTTPLANGALGAEDGKEILLATDAEAFADRILELLADPQKALELGNKGREFIHENFVWEAHNRRLEEALLGLIKQ